MSGDHSLKSVTPVTDFSLAIATLAAQSKDAVEWQRQLARPASPEVAARRTAAWWNQFWNRSWIIVDGDQAEIANSKQRLRLGVDSNGENRFGGAIVGAVWHEARAR